MLAVALLALGVVLGGFGARLGEQMFDGTLVKIRQLARRRQNGFPSYFKGIRPSGTDVITFTLTARVFIPITDMLYLHFIRWLLVKGLAKRAILVVWVQQADRGSPEMAHYWSYVNHCFYSLSDRVRIVDSSRDDDPTVSPASLTPLFWSALEQLTSSEYYKWVRDLGIPARALRHMNRARPGDLVLRGLVAHTFQNSATAPAIVAEALRNPDTAQHGFVLSVLVWELEVDRLAVYYELYNHMRSTSGVPTFTLNPIRGITIRQGRSKAGDNHTPQVAIGLAGSPLDQLTRIRTKPRREIKQYVLAVKTVLEELYDFTVPRREWHQHGQQMINEWRIAERLDNVPALSRAGLELVFALGELRHRKLVSPLPTLASHP